MPPLRRLPTGASEEPESGAVDAGKHRLRSTAVERALQLRGSGLGGNTLTALRGFPGNMLTVWRSNETSQVITRGLSHGVQWAQKQNMGLWFILATIWIKHKRVRDEKHTTSSRIRSQLMMGEDHHMAIVTTAALPWMTGTAVNPLLRAAYLAKAGKRVTLMVPWLHPVEQGLIFPEGLRFITPAEQAAYILNWLRVRPPLPPLAPLAPAEPAARGVPAAHATRTRQPARATRSPRPQERAHLDVDFRLEFYPGRHAETPPRPETPPPSSSSGSSSSGRAPQVRHRARLHPAARRHHPLLRGG